MASRIVIDGNAFYEIDEDCMRRKKKRQEKEKPGRPPGQDRKKDSPRL